MFKKSLLCSALAIATMSPLGAFAMHQSDATTTTSSTTTTTAAPQNAVSDTEMVSQIKALFAKSLLLKGKSIDITSANHQVTLRGKLDTDMEYERAVSLAESVTGVDDVNADNLLVKDSKSPMSDTFITAKVKGAVMKEKLFGDKDVEYWPVSVETKNGVVYLSGNVDTDEQRTNIVNLVKALKGVQSVKSALTVNSSADNTTQTTTKSTTDAE